MAVFFIRRLGLLSGSSRKYRDVFYEVDTFDNKIAHDAKSKVPNPKS